MTLRTDAAAAGLSWTRGAAVNLAFRVQGEGPAVVLLHGTSANFAVWEPVAESLSARAKVISVDQRGHGRSDKPESGYDGISFAADIITVLDALGIERAIIGGHSLGARNAWVAAARNPERVAAVLAVDYTPFVEKDALDTLAVRVAGGDRRFADTAEIEAYIADRYARMPLDAVQRRARWGYQQLEDGGWIPLAPAAVLAQVVDGLRTPWDQEFAAVSVPMTCVRGVDSAIVSERAWLAAKDSHSATRWVEAQTDHYVPEEDPGLIVSELTRLLEAVDLPSTGSQP